MQPGSQPIFILGMMRRSGTNHLSDLLLQHPDCVSAAPIHEDHLVQRAGHLREYVDAVSGGWTASWGVPPGERARLLRALGAGIVDFLQSAPGAAGHRVVTKTPRIENLDLYPDLFAAAPLLVLVRDGRNVVASNVRSFDLNEESVRQDWASAGRTVLAFDARNRDRGLPYRIVRYEDLFENLEPTMTEILRTCGLDSDRFDFAAAAALPVRGSSAVRDASAGVHWQPVTKDDTFAPNERWQHWTPYQHARFARVAGEVQRALGYDLEGESFLTAKDRLREAVDDATWSLRSLRRRLRARR